jgi:uncharacterized repeat protein (TIGR01451 family)
MYWRQKWNLHGSLQSLSDGKRKFCRLVHTLDVGEIGQIKRGFGMKIINDQQATTPATGVFQMHGKGQRLVTLMALLLITTTAWAKPEITLSVTSEKEVVEKQNGKNIVKRVPAKDVESGQVLIFTLKYSNSGNENAKNVVFDNPIPKETVYEIGSAKGVGSEITFSINDGKSYKKPSMLTYEIKGPDGKRIRKNASPEKYTNVRWVIPSVPPGGGGELSYRVRVR